MEPEKLDNDPFIQQVMADVEQIAADEAEPRFSVVMTSDAFPDPEDAFAVWDNQTTITIPPLMERYGHFQEKKLRSNSWPGWNHKR